MALRKVKVTENKVLLIYGSIVCRSIREVGPLSPSFCRVPSDFSSLLEAVINCAFHLGWPDISQHGSIKSHLYIYGG